MWPVINLLVNDPLFRVWIATFGLCWGSFLNVVAYRFLVDDSPFRGRSACPRCGHVLQWYELVPVFSWIILRRRCRSCKGLISPLYPFIELLTAFVFLGLVIGYSPRFWAAYFLYTSALIVSIRTDIAEFTIMRQMTLGIIPFGLTASVLGYLPLTFYESCLGAAMGGGLLALVRYSFLFFAKKDGMGQGDIELGALIGTFTGITGWWCALMIGSLAAVCVGLVIMFSNRKDRERRQLILPFGAFFGCASLIYLLWSSAFDEIISKMLFI